jgi:hypothetical protein
MTGPFIPAARIERSAAELTREHQLMPGFDVEQLLDELGLGLVWDRSRMMGVHASSASSFPKIGS